tara:strand:+ start:440 stop:682 length:243 start_codon:yes stop_codon:yes gene_type:complete
MDFSTSRKRKYNEFITNTSPINTIILSELRKINLNMELYKENEREYKRIIESQKREISELKNEIKKYEQDKQKEKYNYFA